MRQVIRFPLTPNAASIFAHEFGFPAARYGMVREHVEGSTDKVDSPCKQICMVHFFVRPYCLNIIYVKSNPFPPQYKQLYQ